MSDKYYIEDGCSWSRNWLAVYESYDEAEKNAVRDIANKGKDLVSEYPDVDQYFYIKKNDEEFSGNEKLYFLKDIV